MTLSEADKYAYTYQAWAEAFAIFARYENGKDSVDAQHDKIYAGPDPKEVSAEDKARLEVLHWYVDDDNNCFYRFT